MSEVTPAVNTVVTVGKFDCLLAKETFRFRITDKANCLQGVEYEEVADEKGAVKYRRKAETLEVPYPLLSSFGIASDFNQEKGCYDDKIHNYIFSLIQSAVYEKAQAIVSEGKSFSLDELDFETLANEEPAKRGGRRADIAAELLDAGIKALDEYLQALNLNKDVRAVYTRCFKQRFSQAASMKTQIIEKMSVRLAEWYSSLSVDNQEIHRTFFEFCAGKLTQVLEAEDMDA